MFLSHDERGSRGWFRTKTLREIGNGDRGKSRRCLEKVIGLQCMFSTGSSVGMVLIRLRPRQVRYQAALRPDICCFLDFKPLSQFPIPSGLPKSSQNTLDRGRTVTKPHQLGLSVSKPGRSSLAFRFIFCRASLFICSFICEYFLNTFASPCRSSCVTHSSAIWPLASE